ncbi:Uncharacterised protein [Serratia quinivorans]|uniref:MbcA/ParS/Xre antitoxin family protein n=1 Tax=Serratia TaxID=613 RepID=UPI00217B2F0B|nr:MbcA/ParS/Xre antitoxin family protein [Serratia quinivorans]CAI0822554.1 Uncharacterised protein [Serratia quinivorans]CAI0938641.1 Uncharacterised protein [Serratia quinivorans]CAI0955842.1 Uncharacterised protein [Serratia quinivorans]CAI1744841.1 Uncharacterised protein [Serratia quinivorans]CAI2064290.1 Uncharacterised protein [Serratia quinivorans]
MTLKQQTHRRQGHRTVMQMLTADQLQHLKPSKHSARFLVIEIDPETHTTGSDCNSDAGNSALRKKLTDMINDPAVDPNAAIQMLEIAWDMVTKSATGKIPAARVDVDSEKAMPAASIFAGFPEFQARNEERKQDLRQYLLADAKWLTSAELSDRAGFKNRNRSAGPNGWKQRGKIFAISVEGHDRYPAYALDEAYQPLKILKDILTVFGDSTSAWSIASWMGTANSWLEGKKPKDLMKQDPAAVLHAALIQKAGAQHG